MAEIGALYRAGRLRISELVGPLGAAGADRPVPACPGWAVRDVVAHLAGACADALAGRLDGVTTAAWADAQVDQRRERTIAELLEEWSTVAPPLEASADERLPSPLQTIWVLDVTAHEHDVRGALDRPGARDTEALLLVLDFLVREFMHRKMAGAGVGPVEIRTPVRSWVVGPDGEAGAVATLDVSPFELFRALTGRRSTAQIARLDWSADPSPYLPAFEFGTFTTRTTDLVE
ncbi:MAG: maleylpyruvate isomerase family mycothiol-dependent enzyme [Acidimicrobiales bacterium]